MTGAGSLLYGEVPQGPPPPFALKIAKFARGDPEPAKRNWRILEKPRKQRGVHNLTTHAEGSDGCISTTAFFMEFRVSQQQAVRVSCQEDKDGRSGSQQLSGCLREAVLPLVRDAGRKKCKRQAEEVLLG